jgi:hypothetical protein
MNIIHLYSSVKYLIPSNFFPTCGHVKDKIQGDLKISVHNTRLSFLTTWLNLAAWHPTARARGTLDLH